MPASLYLTLVPLLPHPHEIAHLHHLNAVRQLKRVIRNGGAQRDIGQCNQHLAFVLPLALSVSNFTGNILSFHTQAVVSSPVSVSVKR